MISFSARQIPNLHTPEEQPSLYLHGAQSGCGHRYKAVSSSPQIEPALVSEQVPLTHSESLVHGVQSPSNGAGVGVAVAVDVVLGIGDGVAVAVDVVLGTGEGVAVAVEVVLGTGDGVAVAVEVVLGTEDGVEVAVAVAVAVEEGDGTITSSGSQDVSMKFLDDFGTHR